MVLLLELLECDSLYKHAISASLVPHTNYKNTSVPVKEASFLWYVIWKLRVSNAALMTDQGVGSTFTQAFTPALCHLMLICPYLNTSNSQTGKSRLRQRCVNFTEHVSSRVSSPDPILPEKHSIEVMWKTFNFNKNADTFCFLRYFQQLCYMVLYSE